MIRCLKICALGIVFSLGAVAGNAQAQGPYSGMGYLLGYPYDQFRLQNIPYYSLYPPVYYSHSVPRTYGYSPFAYPPGFMTPEVVEPVKPAMMINPHVPNAQPTKAAVAGALRIINRHVPQPVAIAEPVVIKEATEVAKEPTAAAEPAEVVKEVAEPVQPAEAAGITAASLSDLFDDLD